MAAERYLQNEPDSELPVIIDHGGRLLPSLHHPGAGLAIAVREAFGAVDSWPEYLCAFPGDGGFDFNVYRFEWLGEVPNDWYDEEGELLPQHRDDDGGLKLPEDWNYRPVLGCSYSGFIGELIPMHTPEDVQISDCSEERVRQGLEVLQWHDGSVVDVQKALQQLGAADPTVPTNESDQKDLAITHFSIVVKRTSAGRSFPGGVEEFDRVFQPSRKSAVLSVMVCMSLSDVDVVLDRLFEAGLIPGQDVAVAETVHGPLLRCSGLAFESTGDLLLTRWTVNIASDPQEGASYWDGQVAYTPDNPLGYAWASAGSEQERQPQVQPIRPPSGLTAHQYYQWRGLYGSGSEDE